MKSVFDLSPRFHSKPVNLKTLWKLSFRASVLLRDKMRITTRNIKRDGDLPLPDQWFIQPLLCARNCSKKEIAAIFMKVIASQGETTNKKPNK
jgi:hypothetical protein